jgi:hypothetical protein
MRTPSQAVRLENNKHLRHSGLSADGDRPPQVSGVERDGEHDGIGSEGEGDHMVLGEQGECSGEQ